MKVWPVKHSPLLRQPERFIVMPGAINAIKKAR